MHPSPPGPSELPPPPPFATPTELSADEEDVDLADDDQGEADELTQDTVEEEIEHLGEASSLEEFFRSQLEDLIDPCLHTWLFDALDFDEVQRQFEGNGRYRYILEGRSIWRVGLPKPSKDKDDSPSPWMPTRGG